MFELVHCVILFELQEQTKHRHSDQMAFSLVVVFGVGWGGHYKWQLVTDKTHTHTKSHRQHLSFSATLKQAHQYITAHTHTHTETLGTDSIEGPEMRHDGTWQSDMECFSVIRLRLSQSL